MDFDVSLSQKWFFSPILLLYLLSTLSLESIAQELYFCGGKEWSVFFIEFQCVICM